MNPISHVVLKKMCFARERDYALFVNTHSEDWQDGIRLGLSDLSLGEHTKTYTAHSEVILLDLHVGSDEIYVKHYDVIASAKSIE